MSQKDGIDFKSKRIDCHLPWKVSYRHGNEILTNPEGPNLDVESYVFTGVVLVLVPPTLFSAFAVKGPHLQRSNLNDLFPEILST